MRCRPVLPAAIAVLALVVGQLVALAHEAGTRHVTCGQHGEELEAATLAGQLDACDHDHLIAVTSGPSGDHADCAITRTLHQSTATSGTFAAPQLVTIVIAARPLVVVALAPTTALYRLAPKTSPPDALLT
jgi:hypothetical protein